MGLWTFAVQRLGFTSDEFWDLTPQEYYAHVREFIEREKAWDFRFAQVAVVVARANGDSKVTAGDIFPRLKQHVTKATATVTTKQAIFEGVQNWVAMCWAGARGRQK